MDRSYELLTEPDQRLFRSIGIFVGGASLQAVNALMNALMSPGDYEMREIRTAILEQRFGAYADEFIGRYMASAK